MNETKHTPGPWWEIDSGVRDSGGQICVTMKAFHYPDQDERFEREKKERAANKTLIAAAPELLAALRGMLNIVSDSRGVAGYHLNGDTAEWDHFDEVDAAEAAIAKATGQPHD